MTEVLNGTKGITAMNSMTPGERRQKHARLVRFLDSGDADGKPIAEIAAAVGVSYGAVYAEFVKRRVPMTPGQKAVYPLPGRKGKRQLPRGEARQKVEAYLKTGGEGTISEIARATGVPRSTVGHVMLSMGLISKPPGETGPPEDRKPGLAEAAGFGQLAEAGSAPEGKLVYLHQLDDGRHAALDLLTGRLWEMAAVRPL